MLKRKMFRDIRLNLSQFITIFLMIFLGVMVYAGVRSYMEGMANTANVFYSENNLQDLDVVGQTFTDEDLEIIKNIEHVKNAERKLTITGTMESEENRTLQINFIKIETLQKAKNTPCVFNNWANFYKGEFISNTILNSNSFKKIIEGRNS